MRPGSVIKYIDNERYEIIKGGDPAGDKYRNREEVEKEVPLLMVEEYPEPEQGMMVYYADDGQVNKIIFGSKEAEERWLTLSPEEQKKIDEISKSERQNANYSDNEISDLTIEELIDRSSLVLIAQWGSNPNKLYKSGNTGIRIGKGRATVFGDRVGQQNHVLKKGDVATKLVYDNITCGRVVKVSMTKKNSSQSLQVSMVKWDAGGMPNAIVDIWKTGIDYWGYTYTSASLTNWAKTGVTIMHGL